MLGAKRSQALTGTRNTQAPTAKAIDKEIRWRYKKKLLLQLAYFGLSAKVIEAEWKDHIQNGKAVSWHKNGVKKSESVIKDGKRDGKRIEWDMDGNKIKDQEFKDNVMIKDYLAPSKQKILRVRTFEDTWMLV